MLAFDDFDFTPFYHEVDAVALVEYPIYLGQHGGSFQCNVVVPTTQTKDEDDSVIHIQLILSTKLSFK
mgnify:CR=1 FL=1